MSQPKGPALTRVAPVITGELKSKIDRVWDAFWSGGISNPLEVIEQITYLLFIHRLDDSGLSLDIPTLPRRCRPWETGRNGASRDRWPSTCWHALRYRISHPPPARSGQQVPAFGCHFVSDEGSLGAKFTGRNPPEFECHHRQGVAGPAGTARRAGRVRRAAGSSRSNRRIRTPRSQCGRPPLRLPPVPRLPRGAVTHAG